MMCAAIQSIFCESWGTALSKRTMVLLLFAYWSDKQGSILSLLMWFCPAA